MISGGKKGGKIWREKKKSGKEKDLAGKQEIISGVNQASLRRDEKEENTHVSKVLKHSNKRKL